MLKDKLNVAEDSIKNFNFMATNTLQKYLYLNIITFH